MDRPNLDTERYSVDCAGDCCVGDIITFSRATFLGSFKKPKFEGYEIICGTIFKESYGKKPCSIPSRS